ncbi:diguanylate cyclase (GGDEF) domain-containing protein [Ectothiorhodospira magna]|uniref:diguanylate cyclase n=1 Tax=Ectothiorhodospira magna TaxID=867345 RepID=A0A1H9F2Y9_9GAMM|nr:biofilm regulation diguanylate cyclase SiaD [Ectothiorhodospira magna]SEQ32275.1 diguanylate cyclase (GGDEF) domain-containing protein [Ectothiorhodospira magna]
MTGAATRRRGSEIPLSVRLQAAIEGIDHEDHPLLPLLMELQDYLHAQDQRLERLLRIADGYHQLERHQNLSLAERCDRQLKRMEKLARISDQYQRSLWEVTETLRQAANQDPLTGLANRRHLMERLKEETERTCRRQSSLSIALMDVDHFKQINDGFGHETGDQALCRIAEVMSGCVRRYDIHGRWGGEEFLLLMPDTPLPQAVQVLERVRQAVEGITVGDDPSVPPLQLSISSGVTLLRHGEEVDHALKRADDALFSAKRLGRNRVETAP